MLKIEILKKKNCFWFLNCTLQLFKELFLYPKKKTLNQNKKPPKNQFL
jgi:hypothetical protein